MTLVCRSLRSHWLSPVWLFLGCLMVSAATHADDISDLLTGKADESSLASDRVISTGNDEKDDGFDHD